jgi:hypothetical protein
MSGGERMNQGRSTVEIPTMGPAPADTSATTSGPSSHNHNALITNNSPIIMLNCQPSSHRETLTTTHADLSIVETVTDKPLHISRHQSFITETDIQQQVLCNPFQSNLVTDLPPIYSHSKVNQNLPLISTPAFNKSLLPNNSLVFHSQPKQSDPPKYNNRTHSPSNRTQSTKKQNRPDPQKNRLQMNPVSTEPVLSLNRTDPGPVTTTLNRDKAVDMDVQTEKKRRREEDNQSGKNDDDLSQHFLSAGPGSQDCREQ